jgi:hypothetical protein
MRKLQDLHNSGGVNSLIITHWWSFQIIYILYSFSLDEFFLMISHRRFLMRQYKYKCSDMPYRFLLIFFPLGFKGVFSGTSYCTLCNIYIRYVSYLLFFPIGVFRRKYSRHMCYSLNSLMRFFLFKVFPIWVIKEITITICCIIFSFFSLLGLKEF